MHICFKMAENSTGVNIMTTETLNSSDVVVCQQNNVCDNSIDVKTMRFLYSKYILNNETDCTDLYFKIYKFEFQQDIPNDYEGGFAWDDILNREWYRITDEDIPPPQVPFSPGTRKLGLFEGDRLLDPIDIFNLFVTDELIYNMVIGTNRNAQKKLKKETVWKSWTNVTVGEMKAFLGVLLDMGEMSLNRFRDYWTTENVYSNVFTRERFLQIFWMFQANHISKDETDKRKRREDRVQHYIYYLEKQFRDYYIPEREIALYTSSLDDDGKVSFWTFTPNDKANYNNIQLHVIADCNTSYVYTIFVHLKNRPTNQLNRQDLCLNSQIVLHLYQKLRESNRKSKGHRLFLDRHFASIVLAKELILLNCYTTATIYRNKRYPSINITNPSMGRVFAYRCGHFLLVFWRHQYVVTMLTTWDVAPRQTKKRRYRYCTINQLCQSSLITNYLTHISGMKSDLYPASYRFVGKKIRSWRQFIFWGLEVALTNSYILYRSQEKASRDYKAMSRTEFVKNIISQLIGNTGTQPTLMSEQQRLNNRLHILEKHVGGKKRVCTVCSNYNVDVELVRTKYFCNTCELKPSLHVGDCFQRYHTMKYYREEPSALDKFQVLPEESDVEPDETDEENDEVSETAPGTYTFVNSFIKQEVFDDVDPNWDTLVVKSEELDLLDDISVIPPNIQIKQEPEEITIESEQFI